MVEKLENNVPFSFVFLLFFEKKTLLFIGSQPFILLDLNKFLLPD